MKQCRKGRQFQTRLPVFGFVTNATIKGFFFFFFGQTRGRTSFDTLPGAYQVFSYSWTPRQHSGLPWWAGGMGSWQSHRVQWRQMQSPLPRAAVKAGTINWLGDSSAAKGLQRKLTTYRAVLGHNQKIKWSEWSHYLAFRRPDLEYSVQFQTLTPPKRNV